MHKLLIAIIIGISAGVIDVIPMIIQKIDKYACISAFIQWLVLGLIIPYVSWDMQPWLKGLIIGEMAALPILVLVFEKDPKSVIPIILFSAFLGVFVGICGAKFVN
jgi:hypothetical protein